MPKEIYQSPVMERKGRGNSLLEVIANSAHEDLVKARATDPKAFRSDPKAVKVLQDLDGIRSGNERAKYIKKVLQSKDVPPEVREEALRNVKRVDATVRAARKRYFGSSKPKGGGGGGARKRAAGARGGKGMGLGGKVGLGLLGATALYGGYKALTQTDTDIKLSSEYLNGMRYGYYTYLSN